MSIPSFPPRSEDTLKSDSAGIPGATEIKNLVNISQASYDALAVKDSSTLYVVNGAGALVAGATAVYAKVAVDVSTDSIAPGESLLQLPITQGVWMLTGLLIAYDQSGTGDASIGALVTTDDSNIVGAFAANSSDGSNVIQISNIEDWQAVAKTSNPGDTVRRRIPFNALISCPVATDTVYLNIGDENGDGDTFYMGAGTWMAATKVD